MLSLVGSIQPDPFSPHHVPSAQTESKVGQFVESENDEGRDREKGVVDDDDSDDALTFGRKTGLKHTENPTSAVEGVKEKKRKKKEKDHTVKQGDSKDVPVKDGIIKKSKGKKAAAIDDQNLHEKGQKSMDEHEQKPKKKKIKKQDV